MPDEHALVIAGVTIWQDINGRYNLNLLHQASDYNQTKTPGHWLKRKHTKELISSLSAQVSYSPLEVVHGGERAGTYAHELLAVSYAGWISPAFQLKVNQAFIDMKKGQALPQVKNAGVQMLIEMAVKYDQLEQQQQAQEERQREQDAEIRKTQELAIQALLGQQWLTLRQFVTIHNLSHQLPMGREQQDCGRYLTGFCRERNIPIYKQESADRYKEWTYPVWVLQQVLPNWAARRYGQVALPDNVTSIHEAGVAYG